MHTITINLKRGYRFEREWEDLKEGKWGGHNFNLKSKQEECLRAGVTI